MNLYTFHDYREYLRHQLEANAHLKGYRKRLAEEAGCQLSYLSQVLHSHVELTPDHAAGLVRFWKLDEDETQYFLALVHHSRAASAALRELLERQLSGLRAKHEQISRRIGRVDALEGDHRAAYYGAWYLSAVHVLILVPRYRTTDAIAAKLRLPPALVTESLCTLEQMGLARRKAESWLPTKKNVHLSPSSPFAALQHAHWRQKTALELQERREDGLHYTGVHALSRADLKKIRALLLDAIESARQIIDPSAEEDIACFIVDFYGL